MPCIAGAWKALAHGFHSPSPVLMIALLILDFDLYAPTKAALAHLLPLVVKGGVVAFDELAMAKWKGETIAFKEFLSCNNVKLERFPFHHTLSYFTV